MPRPTTMAGVLAAGGKAVGTETSAGQQHPDCLHIAAVVFEHDLTVDYYLLSYRVQLQFMHMGSL